jgi:hypothetical protein
MRRFHATSRGKAACFVYQFYAEMHHHMKPSQSSNCGEKPKRIIAGTSRAEGIAKHEILLLSMSFRRLAERPKIMVWSRALPAGLALVATATGFAAKAAGKRRQ